MTGKNESETPESTEDIRREREQLISIFDNINQIIYVSDMDTFEVLYVNKYLRALLGEDPVGKLCYEEFQGLSSKCDFCTNQQIRELGGKPHVWEHHNPKLGKHFLVTDRIIEWTDGKMARFELALDITELKETQVALASAEERYRELFESSLDGIGFVDKDGRIIAHNDAMREMTGYSSEEIEDMTFTDITPKKWHEYELKILTTQVNKRGYSELYEKEYIRKDGSILPVELRTYAIKDEDGEITGYWAFIRDITERKLAERLQEEARVYAEKRFEAFMESSPSGFLVFDSELKLIEINPSAMRMLLWEDKEELIGSKLIEVIPQIVDTKIIEEVSLVLETGTPLHYDDIFFNRSGEENHFEIRVFRLNGGIGMIASDITALKNTMHDLRERIKEMTCLRGVTETIRDTSRPREERLAEIPALIRNGWQFPEITSVRVSLYNDVYTTPDFSESRWKLETQIGINEKSRGSIELFYSRNPFDTTDPFLKEEHALIESLGAQIGASLTRIDAEEELKVLNKELEDRVVKRTQELEDAQERLVRQERLALLGQLSGGVGHELRNPLGAIKNAAFYLDMVCEDVDEDTKEMIDIIQKEVMSCERIVSSLLHYARPTSPILQKTDIKVLLDSSLDKAKLPETIKIVRDYQDGIPVVLCDQDQISRVFLNLITNAIQAMPHGGTLTLTTRMENNESLVVSVSDTGVGIAEKDLHKIFEPLFTTKAKGIGLGLAISKSTVESHKGRISVDSTIDKGTTFTVSLPIVSGE